MNAAKYALCFIQFLKSITLIKIKFIGDLQVMKLIVWSRMGYFCVGKWVARMGAKQKYHHKPRS